MTIEGPLAYILVTLVGCYVVSKAAEFFLGRRSKKRGQQQIALIEKRMALIKEKMQTHALDLQESLTILNREYSDTIQSYYQKYSVPLEERDSNKENQDTSSSVQKASEMAKASQRNIASEKKTVNKSKKKNS